MPPTSLRADVLIVGLGPTGAVLAGLLAQRGHKVAVFDRATHIYPKPRAVGLDHEFMRTVQGLGLAGRILPHTAAYRPSEYRGLGGRLIKRLDMAPPPHRLGWAPNYVFDQPAVEGVLREHLAADPNVTIQLGAEVTDTAQEADGVSATVRHGDGQVTTWRGSYLVGCDGGSSGLRKQLGIAMQDLGFDERWLVVDTRLRQDVLERLPQTNVQYCNPARPATFVVVVGNHRRWEIRLLEEDPADASDPDEARIWALLSPWITPADGELWRAATYRFHALVAERWRSGRRLLAGDAAHMTPPFMAQGMMQGTRDAANLAWKLDWVLRGLAPRGLLESYDTERIPHVRATTEATVGLGRLICQRDPDKARERDEQLLAAAGGEVTTEIRGNLIPDLAAGLLDHTAGAGSLLPQPRVLTGDARPARLLDDVTGSGLRLVTTAPAEPQAARLTERLAPYGGMLVRLAPQGQWQEAEPLIAPWLASLAGFGDGGGPRYALVRPDHVVYGTATDGADALTLLARFEAAVKQPQQH